MSKEIITLVWPRKTVLKVLRQLMPQSGELVNRYAKLKFGEFDHGSWTWDMAYLSDPEKVSNDALQNCLEAILLEYR